jgi:hypothetical protein
VIWRFDWPIQRGKHTFTVRCFEEDGTSQIAQEAPPDPSGATALRTRSVMLRTVNMDDCREPLASSPPDYFESVRSAGPSNLIGGHYGDYEPRNRGDGGRADS